METLPYIDENIIKNSEAKWVQGFSDVSLLNFYLTTNYNIATIHSTSFSAYGMNIWDKSIEVPFAFVQNPTDFTQNSFELFEKERNREEGTELDSFNLTDKVIYKNLYENANREESSSNNISKDEVTIKGRLIGGCLDVLKILLGTSFDKTKEFCASFPEGMLWYIENCEMSVSDLKRTLWQMKMADWFENTNGFIIGRTRANADMWDFTYLDALRDIFDDMNVPVIYDIDVGHVAPQWTMVNGALAEFKYKDGRGVIRQELN